MPLDLEMMPGKSLEMATKFTLFMLYESWFHKHEMLQKRCKILCHIHFDLERSQDTWNCKCYHFLEIICNYSFRAGPQLAQKGQSWCYTKFRNQTVWIVVLVISANIWKLTYINFHFMSWPLTLQDLERSNNRFHVFRWWWTMMSHSSAVPHQISFISIISFWDKGDHQYTGLKRNFHFGKWILHVGGTFT